MGAAAQPMGMPEPKSEAGVQIRAIEVATGREVGILNWNRRERTTQFQDPFKFGGLLRLNIQAFWSPSERIESSADVASLTSIEFSERESTRGIHFEIGIRHQISPYGCHLVCLRTGETSRGPCLTCRTEKHSVRICC